MHRNNKTRKSIAVLLVTLITVAMLGISPTLAEAGSCKGAVATLVASGAACVAAAQAGSIACAAESRHRPLLYHLGHGVRRGRHCRSADLRRCGAAQHHLDLCQVLGGVGWCLCLPAP